MWLQHVVIVQGGGAWSQALCLWLVAAGVGGGFAWLAGEAAQPDQLLADLALAAAGATVTNAAVSPFGTDPIAQLFDVRAFWCVFGATLLLCLAHDAARIADRRRNPGSAGRQHLLIISERGGFAYLIEWLSGWPSEPGLVDATYGNGLKIRLLPESLHYQTRAGPFRASHTVPLQPGLLAAADGSTLILTSEPDTPTAALAPEPAVLTDLVPAAAAGRLASAIAEVCTAAPEPSR